MIRPCRAKLLGRQQLPVGTSHLTPEMSSYKDTSLISDDSVSFDFDEHEVKCMPIVVSMDGSTTRPFTITDMERVADFDTIPSSPSNPLDSALNVGEPKNPSVGRMEILEQEQTYSTRHEVVFHMKHVALRGKFLFVFDENGVEWNEEESKFAYNQSIPHAVIPLERCVIETPPGGRRVFREHALLAQGYEFAIRHTGPKVRLKEGEADDDNVEAINRIPVYLVAPSLIQRDAWIASITARVEARGSTMLKLIKVTLVNENDEQVEEIAQGREGKRNLKSIFVSGVKKAIVTSKMGIFDLKHSQEEEDKRKRTTSSVVEIFGANKFSAEQYMLDFLATTDKSNDIANKMSELDTFHDFLKDGLKSAVLEQYKYFVDASREISVMGSEISQLKRQVEEHTELVDTMKGINFTGGLGDDFDDDNSISPSMEYDDNEVDSISSNESVNSKSEADYKVSMRSSRFLYKQSIDSKIEISDWFFEAPDEILAFIKECRYTEATHLILKLKEEVARIMREHKEVSGFKLEKIQQDQVQHVDYAANRLVLLIRERLVERLRLMNEALKQERKRERADPLSEQSPFLSPVCLMDDDLSLLLLVKLKRYQDAALAYGTRRSLLLEEILNERYIATHTAVDIELSVIQLSRAYFCSISEAVTEFLDLLDREDDELGQTNVHDGAMSQIVLWCDSEIDKFTKTLGGPHILGRLALSSSNNARSSSNQALSIIHDVSEQRKQLQTAEDIGNHAAAAALRRKIALSEEEAKLQQQRQQERLAALANTDGKSAVDSRVALSAEKDRQVAVKVAAKCIGHTFRFASESLDTIGLPMVPRLASSFRPHLKGCQTDIAVLLKPEWNHLVSDW